MRSASPASLIAGVALAALVTAPARGEGIPPFTYSTVPCAISVTAAPAASAAQEFEIVVRDGAQMPVPGAIVTIDFSRCGPAVRIAQGQPPGTSVDCVLRTVSRVTDAQGRVTFRVIGGGSGAVARADGPCAWIYADGVLLQTTQVAIYDLDGVAGLTAADLSRWLQDFFACPIPPDDCARSDYNFAENLCATRELTASDLSRWLDAFFVAGGTWAVPFCTP